MDNNQNYNNNNEQYYAQPAVDSYSSSQDTYYSNEQVAQPEPTGKAIVAMILGIASIWMGFIPGIVLAILAGKFSAPILEQFPDTKSAKFANVGRITGKIGLIVSIVTTIIVGLVIVFYVFLYAVLLLAMI